MIERQPVEHVRWAPRQETDLLQDQVRGIDAWNVARRAIELRAAAAASAHAGREVRLDMARHLDVVRRQHQALIERTRAHMRDSIHLLQGCLAPRAVLAHRSDWFTDGVAGALGEAGVQVVAQVQNGADTVGVAVAEQPDLLMVEDRLPMMVGEEVVRQVLDFAPRTLVAVQVQHEGQIGPFLASGACIAFGRRVPPADVARRLTDLLSQ